MISTYLSIDHFMALAYCVMTQQPDWRDFPNLLVRGETCIRAADAGAAGAGISLLGAHVGYVRRQESDEENLCAPLPMSTYTGSDLCIPYKRQHCNR